jgi:outer membrane cobalamin receptor
VLVLTARDIEALPVTSFDELLRTAAGVEVQSRGGMGIQSDITIRGSGFNGVLVLLDGARFNDPMTGHFLADFPVPLGEIARVEVLRGPAAAAYGPDALGGVVHLITYTGLRAGLGVTSGALEGYAEAEAGANEWASFGGGARVSMGALRFSAAAQRQDTSGEPILGEGGAPVRSSLGDVRTDAARTAATAALAYATSRATLYARAGYDERDFGAYRFYTVFASDTAREATSTLWAHARASSAPGSRTSWQAHLSARQHEDRYVYNPQTPANLHTSRRVTAQASASRSLTPRLRVQAGGEAHTRSIDSNNMGEHADAGAGAFLGGHWTPAPSLTLSATARADYDPGFGWEPTPQVALAFVQARYGLRAAAGRAVRAPNYIERYFNTTLARPRGRDLGDPDLRAESAWNAEVGADLYPASGLDLHATAFYRSTDDLIDFVQVTPQDTVFLAQNLFDLRTRGLELEARYRRSFGMTALGETSLTLDAAWTYLDVELGDQAAQVYRYKYALTNARHLAQGNLALRLGAVTASARYLWKDRLVSDASLLSDSYGVLDLRLAATQRLRSARFTAHLALRNALDAEYVEAVGAPMPGRWWTAGLAWRL